MRNDLLLFVTVLLEMMEMLKSIKVRHLRSPVPIDLTLLGTEKDKELHPKPPVKTAFIGGPPLPYNFKEQVEYNSFSLLGT